MRLRRFAPLCLKEPELPAVAAAASAAVTASRTTWRYHCRLASGSRQARVRLALARSGSDRPPRNVTDAWSSGIEHLDLRFISVRDRQARIEQR